MLYGCSQDEEEKGESSIDRATKEVADKIVTQIKTPLEKAEAVKEIEEQRTGRLEEQTQ
jgi:hypothetical protein